MSENQVNTGSYNKAEKAATSSPQPEPRFRNRPSQAHIWIGIILLLFGSVFLLRQMGIVLPDWLFSWQMALIVLGLFIGVRKSFQGATWLILILIGTIFLINEFVFLDELRRFILPIILIGSGLFFIFRPKKTYDYIQYDATGNPLETPLPGGVVPSNEDFIDTTAIFGGCKRKVYSKTFRGGDMVNIFGGSEIDLTQADFTGTAVIEATTLFGGATLLVPSHWNVISNAVAILGEVKDKRVMTNIPDNSNKTLIIKGTVIFGGVDIKSF